MPAPPPSFVVLSRKPTECVCLCYSYSVGVMVAQSQVMSPRYFSLFSPKFLRKIFGKFLLTINFCAKKSLTAIFCPTNCAEFCGPQEFLHFFAQYFGKIYMKFKIRTLDKMVINFAVSKILHKFFFEKNVLIGTKRFLKKYF